MVEVILNKPESEWTENEFELMETILSDNDVDLVELLNNR